MMNAKSRAICILGMHRSGTSAIARAMNLLGVDLGDPEKLIPAKSDNPEGFWEHGRIVEIQDQLLEALGSSWSSVFPLPDGWWRLPVVEPYKQELKQLIREEFADKPVWGWKDPRTCLTLPLWLEILGEMNIELQCVLIVRNPLDVGKSLQKRNGFSLEKSVGLWNKYTLSALRFSESSTRIVLQYDHVLEDWESAFQSVIGTLGVEAPQDIEAWRKEMNAFLKPGLRHSKTDVQVLAEEAGKSDSAQRLYQLCLQAEQQVALLAEPEIRQQVREWHDNSLIYAEMFGRPAEESARTLRIAQVFWRDGDGYSELYSQYQHVPTDSGVHLYEMLLPEGVLHELRFDPVNFPAYVEIHELEMLARNREGEQRVLMQWEARQLEEFVSFNVTPVCNDSVAYCFLARNFDPQIQISGWTNLHEGERLLFRCRMSVSIEVGEELFSLLDRNQAQLQAANEVLEQIRNVNEELQMERSRLEGNVQQQREEIASIRDAAKSFQEEIDSIRDAAKSLQEEVAAQQDQLASAAEYAEYLQGEVNKRDAILGEIYSSKAWRLVEAYRRYKYKLQVRKQRVARVVGGIKRRLRYTYEVSRTPVWNDASNSWQLKFSVAKWWKQTTHLLLSPLSAAKRTLYDVRIKQQPLERRPKIIHAIPNTFVGGSTQLIVDLVEYLGHKYDMEIITSALPKDGKHNGLVIHDFSQVQSSDEVAALLKEKQADLVHIHYWGLGDTPWYDKVFDALDQHSCLAVENINTPIAAYEHAQIDEYVYVSEYAQKMHGEWPANSSVIYPGSDFEHFKPSQKNKNPDAIGMVYRLEPDKLREDAIQLFIEIVKRRPRTVVYIVGMGTFFDPYLRQVYEAGVRENFVFTGYVPYGELPDTYDQFSLFVAPVWKESFGQVTPFAMSKELGVAGYDIGALPEILNGRDTLSDDLQELAVKIADLLDDPERLAEMGRQNRERALEMFSVQSMVGGYDALYEKLLNTKGMRK